ncbi:uncharacterized protein LOC131427110 [Malaya genurostris]|uniref:uncharacterized protein LOC131427110 n=1 Tax=Malaya genurostris TaxID=325434 RepID=UPI0026F3970E|nr:uncharacterized protein LOC131427110 [Malaya genurostris]
MNFSNDRPPQSETATAGKDIPSIVSGHAFLFGELIKPVQFVGGKIHQRMAKQMVWTTDGQIDASRQFTSKKNIIHPSSSSNGSSPPTNSGPLSPDNPYLVGVQSRFRRRYYHKTIFIVLIVVIVILLIGLIVVACLLHIPPDVCNSAECLRSAATLKQSMDTSVDPCEDFYRYTCGNWADDHPRPDSYTSYDWFSERQAKILRNIRQYLQMNETDGEPKPVSQARSMYKACMNLTAMDALGYEPVFTLLDEFHLPRYPTMLNLTETDYESYSFDWVRALARVRQQLGMDIMIGFDVFPNPTDRNYNVLVLGAPEKGSDFPFNENVLKHVVRAKRIALLKETEDDSDHDDDDDDEDYSNPEDNTNYIKAYKNFMIGAMKVLVNSTDSRINLDTFADSFTKAADIYVKMSRVIMKFDKLADNNSKSNNPDDSLNLQDLVNTTVYDLQTQTDQYLAPKQPLPIWKHYLEEVFEGIPEAQLDLNNDLILTSNADIYYLQLLADYLSRTPLVHIELFIWWTVVEELILHTTAEIRRLHYDYYKVTTVTEGYTPRSLYCAGAVNKLLGMAVSYAISDQNFVQDIKPKVETMLQYIQDAFERLVRDTTWMDWKTKQSTLEKSKAMRSLIGFPEWILQEKELEEYYDKLDISDTQHLENMIQIIQSRNVKQLRRWRLKNVLSWDTVPTNVNAFHTFQDNAITIPIAILQYPFYHLGLEALNYGAIGTILGHELTHGFDDSGRQFDKEGNLKQWWTNSTVREYVNKTACFIQQYSGYFIDEANDYIDGKQTLGENIADNGGVREAYHAYRIYLQHNEKEPLLPGFENYTHEQLFFISYGNLWCESHTVSAAKAALDDTHCPGWIRLKGVLSNSQEFSRTFNCKRGSQMNPATDKCQIWKKLISSLDVAIAGTFIALRYQSSILAFRELDCTFNKPSLFGMEEYGENRGMGIQMVLHMKPAMNTEVSRRYDSERQRPATSAVDDGRSPCRVFCTRFIICILLLAVILLSSIIYAIFYFARTLPDVCHSKECLRSASAFKQSMDLTVDPCEDFYTYVCGNWADDHPRPVTHPAYSWYNERQDKVYRNIMAKLEMNVTQFDPKPVAQSKAMYKACLDTVAREREGFKAVAKYLKEFGLPTVPTLLNYTKYTPRNYKFDWITSVAKIQRKLGLNVIIGFDIIPDYQNKTHNRLTLEYFYAPGDFFFPYYEWSRLKPKRSGKHDVDDEDYDDENSEDEAAELSELLKDTIEAVKPSIDTEKLQKRFSALAEQFIRFRETLPDVPESEEEESSYYSVQELQNLTDSYLSPKKPFPIWQRYLDVLFADLPEVKPTSADRLQIESTSVEYLQKLVKALSRQSDAQIELYVWITVADYLVNNELNDVETEQACAEHVQKFLGLAVNYAISDKNFLVETKPRVERMLQDIRAQFERIVMETDWMDSNTKKAALEKSKAMNSFIGFPEWILDVEKLENYYEGLQISEKRHLENWVNAMNFLLTDKLRSWRLENNRFSDLNPAIVNAYNLQQWNLIYIPVAIIQYPYYYLGLEALNYGALGETLGHELTHGFDDSGRLYDKHGNMRRWWSNQTAQEYDNRANCLVKQYSSYYDTLAKSYVNGNLTLGENIADNGGLREAFWAYRSFVKDNGSEPVLPGFEDFTHEQLLFISFGNQYCDVISPGAAKWLLKDEHSPSRFRVLGVLSNMEEFSEVFRCPIGSAMNPENKCRIW